MLDNREFPEVSLATYVALKGHGDHSRRQRGPCQSPSRRRRSSAASYRVIDNDGPNSAALTRTGRVSLSRCRYARAGRADTSELEPLVTSTFFFADSGSGRSGRPLLRSSRRRRRCGEQTDRPDRPTCRRRRFLFCRVRFGATAGARAFGASDQAAAAPGELPGRSASPPAAIDTGMGPPPACHPERYARTEAPDHFPPRRPAGWRFA